MASATKAKAGAAMRSRCEAVMNLAASHGCEALVAGAFGCGVFGNDPYLVARCFLEWISACGGAVREVCFAVPGGANYEAFEQEIGGWNGIV
jgi:uncharacterized protein (TIGR02452 family)